MVGGTATGTPCDMIPPSKIAEVSGYPVKHLFAPDPALGGLDCYYTVEKASPADGPKYPRVRLWMPKSVSIGMTCETKRLPVGSDSRCANPAGVGDQARLESEWEQDQKTNAETNVRRSHLLVSAGGKWYAAFITTVEPASNDVAREEAVKKVAALVYETYVKTK